MAGSFRVARQTNIAANTYRDVLGWTNPDCGYGKVLDLAGKDLNLTVSEMSQEQRAAKQRPELSPGRGFASLGLRRKQLSNGRRSATPNKIHCNVNPGLAKPRPGPEG
jgi:hypothetical protein